MESHYLVMAGVGLLVLGASLGFSLVAICRPRRAVRHASIGLVLAVAGAAGLSVRLKTVVISSQSPAAVTWQFNLRPLFYAAALVAILAGLVAVVRKNRPE